MRIVDIEYSDGGAAGLCAAGEDWPEPFEVAFPQLATGIEKPDDVVRYRVPAAQIGAFVQVTSMAAPTSVSWIVG